MLKCMYVCMYNHYKFQIVSPSKGKVSEFRAEVSSAATLLSVNPLYFKASMIQFGQKILKLTQVCGCLMCGSGDYLINNIFISGCRPMFPEVDV